MKTVWHWKNIGKALVMVILVAFIGDFLTSLFQLPFELSLLIGLVIGNGVAILSLVLWDLWHFE